MARVFIDELEEATEIAAGDLILVLPSGGSRMKKMQASNIADVLGSAAVENVGTAAGEVPVLDADAQIPLENCRRMEFASITLAGSSAVDITGIPSWAKKITVWWWGVGEGAEAAFIRGITASGVVVGTSYSSSVMGTGSGFSGSVEGMNNGLRITTSNYSNWVGCGTLIKRPENHIWNFGFSSSNGNGGIGVGGGQMNVGEVLTGLRFQITGGGNFSSGVASIMVEG